MNKAYANKLKKMQVINLNRFARVSFRGETPLPLNFYELLAR